MKLRPFLSVAFLFIVVLGLSSCYPQYTCQCTISYSGAAGLPDTLHPQYKITDTKANAKSKCASYSGTFDNNGIHTVENCVLY